MAISKTESSLLSSQSNAAGATIRASFDVRSAYGGIISLKITNGSTGPTAQCTCNVLSAHSNSGTTPTLASANADWKTKYSFGGGTTANKVTESSFEFGPTYEWIEVEFTGNTGQAVTIEAFATLVVAF